MRGGNLATVRAAIRRDPEAARRPRPVVEAGRLAFCKALALLHRNGADLNASFRGYRALHALLQEDAHAARGKPSAERLECLDWLLAHGADPEQLGAWPPARALIIAAFVGEAEYAKRLRQAGAKIDGFVGAALGDRKLVANALKKRPGFARERDLGGLTALQCAVGTRFLGAKGLEIAALLLDAGADPNAKTASWGQDVDVTHFAASAKNKAMFGLLLERGASPTPALVAGLWSGTLELAELALSHGAELDHVSADGQPLLNNLIRWGQMLQTMWMLAHGASPNLADERGWTAVHQAASRGNARMMRAVLEGGGDLTRRDNDGNTPLALAQVMGRKSLIPLLK